MKRPKISVVMATYNHVDYVGEAIESVLNQTYRDFEFIIADDFSTDGTVEKIMQYEDKIDEIHLFDYNSGNRGAFLGERVKGEYVAILNSDDVWETDKLEKQIKILEDNPNAAGCFTWAKMIGGKGENVDVQNPFCVVNREKEEWMNYFYFHGNCMAHDSLLMKAEIYYHYRNKGTEMFRQLPDFYLWIQMVQEHEVIMLEEPLTRIRIVDDAGRKNVSAVSRDNVLRHFNEEGYIWYKIITNMDNGYFLKAFKEQLINANAYSDVEILCEKFFILLRARLEYCRIAAIFFGYDNFIQMQDELQAAYGFTRKDFYELVANSGPSLYID
ncbi:MAG: glycosyltransferase [Lachnospiraceae bacterium]|nr:glycosyltransferase [Lachnospiraceae bacterium]